MQRTLGTDENFITSTLTKNVLKKIFSYFNPTCAKYAKIAYMYICFKPNRLKFFRPARSRTQKQVVGHDNRGNKPNVRRTLNSKLILSFDII